MQKDGKFYKFLQAAWEYIKTARLELIILVAAVAVDLISKAIVGATMKVDTSVTLIPKFLNIYYTHNPAAAFGSSFGLDKLLGETGVRVVFIIISFVAIGFFGFFMYRNRGKHKMSRVAFALIIGGAIGNLIDRLFLGYVRDFIQFEYFGLTIFGQKTFAIFNFADAALCIGVALFAIYYIFIYKEPKKETEKTKEKSAEEEEKISDEVADEILDEITASEKTAQASTSDASVNPDTDEKPNEDSEDENNG